MRKILMDKALKEALNEVKSSEAQAREFTANPKGYLESKGVNTAGLTFGSVDPTSDIAAAGVCGSVGCIVCATVGT